MYIVEVIKKYADCCRRGQSRFQPTWDYLERSVIVNILKETVFKNAVLEKYV